MQLFGGIYNGTRAFVTGHTGFKGSWLTYWLASLGASVTGYSIGIPTEPSHIEHLPKNWKSITGDINDFESFAKAMAKAQPEILFHLAAQPLVRASYEEPLATLATNIIGTANILEAARNIPKLRAIVIITSDKCYDNKEWVWGYRESDAMGGHDPYSASKGCAEIITASYRRSFFPAEQYGRTHQTLIASARAGNVIGGGDWARDRLIPDIIRAAVSQKELRIRYPEAVRPWQHVLEPLSGYLLLGEKLLSGSIDAAEAWNFGPAQEEPVSVREVAARMQSYFPNLSVQYDNEPQPHEASLLRLDCSKALSSLQWKPVWNNTTALEKTARWYKAFYETELLTEKNMTEYTRDAAASHAVWIKQ